MNKTVKQILTLAAVLLGFYVLCGIAFIFGSREYHYAVSLKNNLSYPIRVKLSRSGPPGLSQTVDPNTESVVFSSSNRLGDNAILTVVDANTGKTVETVMLDYSYVQKHLSDDCLHIEYPIR